MDLLLLFIGLAALLWMLFQRAGGYATVGSAVSLGVTLAVVFWLQDSATPTLVALLFGAVAVALYATTPPAEELAESIGGTLPNERDREQPGAPLKRPIPVVSPAAQAAKAVGDSLTLSDHLWLVGLPLMGFIISFVVLDRRIGLVEGLWFHLMAGVPGKSFAFGMTDVTALHGLLLIFPGGKMVLSLPLTGLLAVLVQLAKNRPTAAAATMEYGVVVVICNLIALLWLPLP
jgi:hypothetical protein